MKLQEKLLIPRHQKVTKQKKALMWLYRTEFQHIKFS